MLKCSNFVVNFLADQIVEKQAENLRNIARRYELDKKKWTEAISSLQEKVKVSGENSGIFSIFKKNNNLSELHFKSFCTYFVLQLMKSDYSQLSIDAHECVDSIPELNKMVFAVQELGILELHYLVSTLLNEELSCT